MSKITPALTHLKEREFRTFFRKSASLAGQGLDLLRAREEDWRIAGISINKKLHSKHRELGAYATESTDYCWLDQIFKAYPLKDGDVFVDVGCGEGRVLTYLYLRGFRGRMTGIELDKDVAATAAERTKKCANIQIRQANVLNCADVIGSATAIYLFNPFDEEMVERFVQMVETHCRQNVTVYYSNDLYRRVLDKRENWHILRRNVLYSRVYNARFYTVYKYRPQ